MIPFANLVFSASSHLVPRASSFSLTSSIAAWLWVMPEHMGLYLVRNLMALHWGCLSCRQAALRQVKEREHERGKEETEKGRES